ncbi:hypothetical protein [Psychroserpens sp.]|uniref:hypothetical protein n=1 Tax=Psychroserpens sp. TaxID=2020870 RepID=UPI001B04CCE5|nr:hypothetical protein [Psychroserpens sp.]MBO6608046.1 hypothetical protein [Psychroserpens sp.]MBO6631537.1 hypothetical protein [Psychroserpens sp.]MBO6655156.1 hypothetical protein [Psychroserpens sp.]MBO6683256.1 hypothetical protein [Psychroserpens sp.]MBO6751419.1 hypothetical protein [Psychroserpens sp.]
MKRPFYLILTLTGLLLLNSCSSAKVLNTWKADNIEEVRDNNLLVIARTNDKAARIVFENEIVDQLTKKGLNATASFTKIPDLNPNQELTEEKKKSFKSMIQNEGFNGVVLTVMKEKEELVKTEIEGAHYEGGTYYGYYPRYYGGLVRYYANPTSYTTLGNYVEEKSTTYTAANYVLETLVFNLDKEDGEELVAVVTARLEEPDNASEAASKYVKAIAKQFN